MTSPPLKPLNPAIIAASERPMANWYRQFPGYLAVFPREKFVIDLDPNEER